MSIAVPAVLMRGGTSKCWTFDLRELDGLTEDRDGLLLRAYGSPDLRQVDGVGGATSTTSKAALLAPSERDGVHVEYTFAQIGITEAKVDWSNNCGNCATVVGLYAVQEGWVSPTGDLTRVMVLNTNTGKLIAQDVPTPGGRPTNEGEVLIDGVPFPGPGIRMGFVRPQGAVTGRLLPTGRAVDHLDTERGQVRATLVDAGNPSALLWGPDLGLDGTELPAQVDQDPDLLRVLDQARAHASELMGIAPDRTRAAEVSRAIPKLAWLAPSSDQRTTSGEAVRADEADVSARMLSMGRTHPALAVTVSVAVAAAAATPGTVVPENARDRDPLRLSTPSGVLPLWTTTRDGELDTVFVLRNARRLATATLDVPTLAPLG
ncbi:PrpF domain-containing protein [Actinoalloteichus spitiensis]|uniref:PrpF domain-containing protein n=1 Tax=Actinoalloteichus spitiensis TaxID=252394 RepID=UPI00058598D0|nr:PrpF domain-containing protein [Actinoalloteichus spitiensis]